MKKISYYIFGVLFVFICVLTLTFLHKFTDYDLTISYVTWLNSEITSEDGTAQSFTVDDTGAVPELNEGEYFRFTGTLGETALDSELVFEALGAELTLYINGTEIYASRSAQPENILGSGQIHIPLPENASGSTVTLELRPLSETAILPPLARTVSAMENEASSIAYANNYGIPAGAYGLVFVIVCGLFLLGLALKKTDWRLLLLILSAAGLTVYELSVGSGYYFFDPAVLRVLTWNGLQLLVPAAMLIYILLNIKNGFLKYFGIVTLWSGAALLAAYLISLIRGSYLSNYINQSVSALFNTGYYGGILHWITVYLVFSSSSVTVYAAVRSLIRTQLRTQALELKSENLHLILSRANISLQYERSSSRIFLSSSHIAIRYIKTPPCTLPISKIIIAYYK